MSSLLGSSIVLTNDRVAAAPEGVRISWFDGARDDQQITPNRVLLAPPLEYVDGSLVDGAHSLSVFWDSKGPVVGGLRKPPGRICGFTWAGSALGFLVGGPAYIGAR